MHREPTLYIVGDPERKDEIKHVIEDEWCGNSKDFSYGNFDNAYFVDVLGCVSCCSLDNTDFKEAVESGLMREYKLPVRHHFKPFDRVIAKSTKGSKWFAGFYSHYESGIFKHILINNCSYDDCLPYNEKTKRLIGTNDEWRDDAEQLDDDIVGNE